MTPPRETTPPHVEMAPPAQGGTGHAPRAQGGTGHAAPAQGGSGDGRPVYPVPPAVPRSTGLGRAAAGSARRGNARVKMAVGLAVSVVVVLGTGTAVYLSRQQTPAPTATGTKSATPSEQTTQPPAKDHQSAQPIDQAAIKALAPRKVRVVSDNGAAVSLKWTLPAGAARYPVVLQREPFEENAQRITPLQAGSTGTRVLGLNPDLGYCFVVGVALRVSEETTVAWSEPACIRGAVPTG